jgi:hypothetical protein
MTSDHPSAISKELQGIRILAVSSHWGDEPLLPYRGGEA